MSYAKSRFLPDDNFDSVFCNEHTFIPGDNWWQCLGRYPADKSHFEQSSM